MEVTASHSYDATLDEVFDFFSDEQRIIAKYQALGARNVELLELQGDEASVVVKTRRDVPATVPSVLKTLLGEFNTLLQSERWEPDEEDNLVCHFSVEIMGVPVALQGQMHLMDVGEGTVNQVSLSISSALPLIGKKLVAFVATDCSDAMNAEYAYIKQQLALRDTQAG